MTSEGKARMVFAFRDEVGGVSLLLRREGAEPNTFTLDANLSGPFAAILSPVNAHEARSVVFPRSNLILHIDAPSHITQVFKAIISLYAVDVVYMKLREFARHIKPHETRGREIGVVQHQVQIAAASVNRSNDLTSGMDRARANESGKKAGYWVVTKQFFQSFLGNHLGHLLVPNHAHVHNFAQGKTS